MKGMIFTAPSVLGLQRRVKTQTRRLAKEDEPPRYKVGETLYAKEAVAIRADIDPATELDKARHYLIYRAGHNDGDLRDEWHSYGRWRSPLFMPEWAARFHVTITEVRTQRLHAISSTDAWAEGIEVMDGTLDDGQICLCAKLIRCSFEDPQASYLAAWNTIHRGKFQAKHNPMVHAYTFTVRSVPE
jgi:hypothetical protein